MESRNQKRALQGPGCLLSQLKGTCEKQEALFNLTSRYCMILEACTEPYAAVTSPGCGIGVAGPRNSTCPLTILHHTKRIHKTSGMQISNSDNRLERLKHKNKNKKREGPQTIIKQKLGPDMFVFLVTPGNVPLSDFRQQHVPVPWNRPHGSVCLAESRNNPNRRAGCLLDRAVLLFDATGWPCTLTVRPWPVGSS